MGTVVGLAERVSTQSFAVSGLILEAGDRYCITGARRSLESKKDYERDLERGDIIGVTRVVPDSYENPVALWIGDMFRANAIEKNAPLLPLLADPYVHRIAHSPHFNGQFSFAEYAAAHGALNDWVRATARVALQRTDRGLVSLLNWSLPDSLHARTAAYFVACADDRVRELNSHLRLLKSAGERLSDHDLLHRYEAARDELLKTG